MGAIGRIQGFFRASENKFFTRLIIAGAVYVLLAGLIGPPSCASLVHHGKDHAAATGPINGKATVAILDDTELPRDPVQMVRVESYKGLGPAFTQVSYDLDAVGLGDGGVPRIYIHALPDDMDDIPRVEVRKELFFSMMLPLALRANEEVAAQRRALLALHERHQAGTKLTKPQRRWLTALAVKYGAADAPQDAAGILAAGDVPFAKLRERVRTVPVPLVLAQAAEESGWGRSRFARQGNAMFGEWTYDKSRMMIPKERDEGRSYGVKTFPTLLDSVRSYLLDLNSVANYAKFREIRSQMLADGKQPTARRLAAGLTEYSARGQAYVKSLRTILDANNLAKFAQASFRSPEEVALAGGGSSGGGGH